MCSSTSFQSLRAIVVGPGSGLPCQSRRSHLSIGRSLLPWMKPITWSAPWHCRLKTVLRNSTGSAVLLQIITRLTEKKTAWHPCSPPKDHSAASEVAPSSSPLSPLHPPPSTPAFLQMAASALGGSVHENNNIELVRNRPPNLL